MRRNIPQATCFSYLDDRLLVADSWPQLDRALAATVSFDLAVGPVLNHDKCACAQVIPSGGSGCKRGDDILRDIKSSKCIKYLGIGLLVERGLKCKVAGVRTADAIDRFNFIGRLPTNQRDALVCDAVASLYLSGGTVYTRGQLDLLSKAAARALNGSQHAHSQNARSRDAMHLVGVGVTRTCAISAPFMEFVRQLWHLLATGDLSFATWNRLYEMRHRCAAGLPRFIEGALAASGIRWACPVSFQYGDRRFFMIDDTTAFGAPGFEAAASTTKSAPSAESCTS
jgi:hypothetical protein